LTDPAVPHHRAGDLAWLDAVDRRRRDLGHQLMTAAQPRALQPLECLGSGLGPRRSLGLRDAIHERRRFPRVQAFASAGRVV
jgi:hypothetical protein